MKGRWYHWVAAAGIALSIILLILPSFIHWNSYRSVIEDLISDQMGAQVSLNGDIQAVLVPRPRITASDVDIPVIGQVQAVDMFLDPAALLTREIIPVDLTVKGARLTVRQQADGRWDYAGQGEDQQIRTAQTTPTGIGQSIFSPELGRMSISKSVISLIYQDGVQQDVAIRSMDYLEREDSQVKTITALLLTRDVPVRVNAKFQPVGTVGNLSARVEAALPAGRLLFSGRVDKGFNPLLGRVSFKGERLDTAFSHLMDVINQQMALTGAAIPFDFDFRLEEMVGISGGIKAKSFAFSLADAPGAAELSWQPERGLDGTVRLGVLQTSQWQQAQFFIDPKKKLNGIDAAVDLLVQGVEGADQTMQQLETRLLLKNGQLHIRHLKALLPGVTQFSLDGGYDPIKRQLVADIALQSASPRRFFQWLGVNGVDEVTDNRLATFSLDQGQLMWSGQDWSLTDMAGRLDASQFTGRVTGQRAPFHLTGVEADFDQLAVTPYQSFLKALMSIDAGKGPAQAIDRAPQNFKLKAGQVFLSDGNNHDLTLSNVAVHISRHISRQGHRLVFHQMESQTQNGGRVEVTGHYPLESSLDQGKGQETPSPTKTPNRSTDRSTDRSTGRSTGAVQAEHDIDLTLSGRGLAAPWVTGFIRDRLPQAALPVLGAVSSHAFLDVDMTLKGTVDTAHMDFSVVERTNKPEGGQNVTLAGAVHRGIEMKGYDLSGRFHHTAAGLGLLSRYMPVMGLFGQTDMTGTLSVRKETDASPIHVAMKGQAVSKQKPSPVLDLSYQYDADVYLGKLRADVIKAGDLTNTLSVVLKQHSIPALTTILPQTPLFWSADFHHEKGQTYLRDMTVQSEDWSLTGGVTYKSDQKHPHISADLNVAGLSYSVADFDEYLLHGWPKGAFSSLPPVVMGHIDLNIKDAQIMGQSIVDLPVELIMSDQSVTLETKSVGNKDGDGGVKQPTVNLVFGLAPPAAQQDLRGQAAINQHQVKLMLDLPAFQTGTQWQSWQKWLPLKTENSHLTVDVSGQGSNLQDIMRRLRGQLSWKAQGIHQNTDAKDQSAAMMIQGFDAGAISWAARTVTSNAAFLKNLPLWTQTGQNRVNDFTVSAVVDSGIALLEQGTLTGPWGMLQIGGQIDFAARAMQLKGDISFAALPDASIGTTYTGPFWGVNKNYDLSQVENFVSTRIQNEQRQQVTDVVNRQAGPSPVMRVYKRMLPSLRQKQKKALETATKALREELSQPKGSSVPQ